MLPPPPVRITHRRSLRDWLRMVDSYTLRAFNPRHIEVADPADRYRYIDRISRSIP